MEAKLKIFFRTALMIISLAMIQACSNGQSTSDQEQPQQIAQPVVKKEETPPPSPEVKIESTKISPKAGLGSTLSDLGLEYGPPTGDLTMPRYMNDYLSVMITDNTAVNLTLGFENTGTTRRSHQEAFKLGKELLPTDAEQVKTYEIEDEKTVYLFKSKLLAKTSIKQEDCLMLVKHDHGNKDSVYSVIVAYGTNP